MAETHDIQLDKENPSYNLTFKDVVDILEIMDHSPSQELHLELGDLNLTIEKK